MNSNDKMNWYFQDAGAGLVAAAMIAIVPGYISRSVAGSYDNEGIAIFCMLLTYALWIKSVKTGSLFWSCLCALAYFYMVILSCKFFKGLNLYVLPCAFILNNSYLPSAFVFDTICCRCRFPHGEVMFSWSTWFLFTSWPLCWLADSLTGYTWLILL